MPMWRCPHCGTPQAETARCWVCRRSSTACGTCRNFRRSVAGSIGYCGLDRRRQPLVGDEIRECWEARPSGGDLSLAAATARGITAEEGGATGAAGRSAPLDFIEVPGRLASGSVEPGPEPSPPSPEPAEPSPDPTALVPPAGLPHEPGWDLWGDLDR